MKKWVSRGVLEINFQPIVVKIEETYDHSATSANRNVVSIVHSPKTVYTRRHMEEAKALRVSSLA